MNLKHKNVLITGGTGSFGKKLTEVLLEKHDPAHVVIFSRDELKQNEMKDQSALAIDERVRYCIGDVRDKSRLSRAFDGIDVVVHAAALKSVSTAEVNPFEAIKTNVIGAQNVIECAIDRGIGRVIALSTDKASNPISLYGATKLCSDKLFVAANSSAYDTAFGVVRYGNVIGSRGSVVPLFLGKRKDGALPITDPRMTRFWITLEEAVEFVLDCVGRMTGGELFIPKLPSMKITEVARVIAPQARQQVIGIRPGEKLHETLIGKDDARDTMELHDRYIILPSKPWRRHFRIREESESCVDGFEYCSDGNDRWLSGMALEKMIAQLNLPEAKRWAREREIK